MSAILDLKDMANVHLTVVLYLILAQADGILSSSSNPVHPETSASKENPPTDRSLNNVSLTNADHSNNHLVEKVSGLNVVVQKPNVYEMNKGCGIDIVKECHLLPGDAVSNKEKELQRMATGAGTGFSIWEWVGAIVEPLLY